MYINIHRVFFSSYLFGFEVAQTVCYEIVCGFNLMFFSPTYLCFVSGKALFGMMRTVYEHFLELEA